jgi:hypothetical protein
LRTFQEQDQVVWVLWLHCVAQICRVHLQGQRTTTISFAQHRVMDPLLQHFPTAMVEQAGPGPQPAPVGQ